MRVRSQYDREILRLAIPALGALAAEPSYILVDTAIVGHLGRPQLAALGIAATVLTALFAVFNFLQYGTTAQVGRASGAGQERAARQLGAQALWLCLGVGLALTAVVIALAPAIVGAMGGQGRRPTTPSPTSGSSHWDSRLRSSRSARRAICAASPTCGRRCES